MFSMFKHAAAAIALAIVLLFSILPAQCYEMDYFPKFNPKQHFSVQKGSVPKNLDEAFFAEMEKRLASIDDKYDTHIYFVCASSDEADSDKLQSSADTYVRLLWEEWSNQGMPVTNTVVVALAGYKADSMNNGMMRVSGWYDDNLKASWLSSTDAEWTLAKSSLAYLVDRNCPHQFIRAATLRLEADCVDIAAKQKAEAARKKAEAEAADAAKIQAARASDRGSDSAQTIATRDAVKKLQAESTRMIEAEKAGNLQLFLSTLAVLLLGGVVYALVSVKRRN